MKTIVLSLVWSLLALSLSAADGEDIVVIEAEQLSAYHRDLAKRLAESASADREVYVNGAMGADSPLPESEDRYHFLNIVHRSGYSWAESHDTLTDFYVILDGSGTLLLGGDMVDRLAIDDRPGEWRAPELAGATRYPLDKGDMINIPSRVPHQWDLSDDESVTYVIVKVVEPSEAP